MAIARGLLLDTHTLIWLQDGRLAAQPADMEQIIDAGGRGDWFISSFALIEIAHAVAKGRLHLSLDPLQWLQRALKAPGPRTLELTPEIAAATIQLPSTFHGDPGDRILAATAVVHGLTICTHDDILLRFGRRGLFSVIKVRELKQEHAR